MLGSWISSVVEISSPVTGRGEFGSRVGGAHPMTGQPLQLEGSNVVSNYEQRARDHPAICQPVITFDVPDGAALNADLRRVIAQREQSHPSTQHSNLGGWQSSWDMDRWGGAPAIKLLAIGRNVANQMTMDRQGNAGGGPHPGYFAVTWTA